MTYTIFGRVIPKQYLSIATLSTIVGVAVYSRSGKPVAPKTVAEAKQAVPINAGSSEEEEFIRNSSRRRRRRAQQRRSIRRSSRVENNTLLRY
ncbi:hypothetical protein B0H10DRAFT_360557 [Mycena sp. CBHHK59/15]|nr:hypothetical protein B0H10DRAFT_360557 [Mycena sp. CBHHK59/15]